MRVDDLSRNAIEPHEKGVRDLAISARLSATLDASGFEITGFRTPTDKLELSVSSAYADTEITNFSHLDDYDQVFILNSGWEPPLPHQGRIRRDSERDRHRVIRSSVPIPPGIEANTNHTQFQFHALDGPPAVWQWEAQGQWVGWKPSSPR